MSEGPQDLEEALQRLRDVLSGDGYGLDWSLGEDSRVTIRIVAGEGACADCLVPLPLMEAIMSDALAPTAYALGRIELPSSS
ncbi:MAG: hypothetical protein JOY82_24915 [Streptosporangiaceae bacterium]|nr:hypothetical protein [Streptosporangiaceae bacterium]MBV9857727.1 hypothetical protein [Streptosporangiaceae bacterium]